MAGKQSRRPGKVRHSSGAALALRAAATGVPMKALVACEPPYMVGEPPDCPAVLGGRGGNSASAKLRATTDARIIIPL
jgi:hypothetical protein